MEYEFNCPICSNVREIYDRPQVREKLKKDIALHGVQNEITGILLKFTFTPNYDPLDCSQNARVGIDMLKRLFSGQIEVDRSDTRVIEPVEVLFLLIVRLMLELHNDEHIDYCYKNRFRCQTALMVLEATNNQELKAELQDYFFSFLSPATYTHLTSRLPTSREKMIKTQQFMLGKMQSLFKKAGISPTIETRVKTVYSTFRKTQRKGILPGDVDDLLGFRIITHSLEECYTVLDALQKKWGGRDQTVQDYIRERKASGYQSIHLHVRIKNIPVEFQIRDKAMHHIAQRGIAAYGEYKINSW